MRARLLLARAMRSRLFHHAIRVLEQSDSGRSDTLAVLTYHRIGHDHDVRGYPGLISAAPMQFDEQMNFLARRYRVISMADLVEAREGQRRLPPKSIMITFDDAYRDFAESAWPILRRWGLPVTLFVPTSYPGQSDRSFWWDWLHVALRAADPNALIDTPAGSLRLASMADRSNAYRVLRTVVKTRPHAEGMRLVAEIAERLGVSEPEGSVLDWPTLRTLAASGVTLAAHTRDHPLLDHVEVDQLDAELRGSWQDLRDQIGETLPVVAYPSGAHSNAVRAAARRIGFRIAFTTDRGVNDLRSADWFRLRRINVGRNSSLNALRAQVGTWAHLWSR